MADFSISEFLAWARTKPADEQYYVCAANACALGQFGSETGREYLHRCYDPNKELGFERLNAALGFHEADRHSTFGALVARLEALIPAKPSEWLDPQAYVDAEVGEYAA